MLKDIWKSHKRICIILIILLAIGVIFFLFNLNSKENFVTSEKIEVDEKEFKSKYEELNDVVNEEGKKYPVVKIPANNNIKYKEINQIVDIFENNKDAVIYFGYPECVYCRSAVQVLFDIAKDTELDTINYLEIKDDTNYDEIMKYLGNEFITTDNNKRTIYSPLVLFVVNGDVVSYNKGTLFSQTDPYVELDNDQKFGLSEIYKYGINDVLTSIRLKSINPVTGVIESNNS